MSDDEQEENGSGYSGSTLVGVGAAAVAIGGLLGYVFGRNNNETPQCHAANTPRSNSTNQQSKTFRNRDWSPENCAICLEEVVGVVILPCTHRFHRTCVLGWIQQKKICPTCRQPAPLDKLRYA